MGIIWIVVGVAIARVLATGIVRTRNRSSESPLGFVSHRWIAEHRIPLLPDE
jgi:hypothetical protein